MHNSDRVEEQGLVDESAHPMNSNSPSVLAYPKKPGVFIVGNFLSATPGTRGVCEDLALRLEAEGHTVITASDKRGRLELLLDMLMTTWAYRHHYAVAQVDVYSGPAFFWAEAVSRMLQWLGKPYILTLHGGNLPIFARRWPWRVRWLFASAAIVTTPSRYLHEQMKHYRTDLRLLPNPLDLRAYVFRPRAEPQPHLMWLRALHAIYNPSLAADVVARLQPSFSDIHVTMVGPDKGDGSLQALQQCAAALGVQNRITLPGGVPKTAVPHWLQKGDIFLNTTNVDNTPVSVIEAMACGLCVVSTNVGGIPYLLEHERDALLVPPDDAEAMAAAVTRLLTEPGLAERLSRNARQKAEQFDWSVIMPQWENILTTLATHTSPTSSHGDHPL